MIFRVFLISFLLATVVAGYMLFQRKVGNLRPAYLPSSRNIVNYFNNHTDFPLTIPAGFAISIFAQDLSGVRDLQVTPEGKLLVSVPSAGKVYLLPEKKEILFGLNRPHGLAFYNGELFVAEETKVTRYFWDQRDSHASLDQTIFKLPKGGRHFTRSLAFDKDGNLYVSVGSTCDVCYEENPWYGTVLISDAYGRNPQVFAKGLRNSVFIKINPETNELWGTEMGRDFLGDDIPPDEVNIIRQGADYGWPICWGNKVHDVVFDKRQYAIDPCLVTQPPVYEIQAHSAPLGLVFYQGDLLVAYHGSWNRSQPTGYKVVRLKLDGYKVTGQEDFVSGWLQGDEALGRPVDIEVDKDGNIFISDDKAGVVYKVSNITGN